MRAVLRSVLIAMVGIVAFSGAATGVGVAAPAYSEPDPDPFYAAPADIASYKPGDVVRVRPIPAAQMAWFANTDGWNIAFRSTSSEGKPIMGMTTLMKPRGVANPPLVSYQAIVNSLGSKCNPSRAIWNMELQDAPGFYLPLMRGWALNIPDHLGPNVAYGAAKLGGMITLDSVRAVKNVAEFGLANAPTVLAGYSGGGMASAWAAALQPTYAPDLQLAGVAAGGIPADFEQMIRSVGFARHPGFGLGYAAAIGLEREYPDKLPISDFLNRRGVHLRDMFASECRRYLLAGGFLHSASDVMTGDMSLIDSPDAQWVVRTNSLRYDNGVPQVPMFIWQGQFDGLTPFDAVQEVVGRYCSQGVPVQFRAYPISEHMTTAALGFPDAWSWVEARLRGEPVPSNC